MVGNSDGSNPVPLTFFKGARHAGAPRWSPDGRRVAFDSQGPDGVTIFTVDAQGGGLLPLPHGNWSDVRPSWSRDSRWIYFGSNRSGTNQVWKSSVTGENTGPVTRNGGYEAFESPDGKTLFYTKNFFTNGLWSLPVEGGEEVALPQFSSVRPGNWAVADRGIYFVDFSDVPLKKPAPVRFFDLQKRQLSTVGAIEIFRLDTAISFSVTHDGRWMAWRQQDRSESNLMLIDNFR
jgi:dipeptidyl aminopeptidase/acylaminoacyl peptidase